MESKVFLSYEEAREIDDIWYEYHYKEDEEIFLNRMGLRADDLYTWFDSKGYNSLLEIACEKRWLLAKIKYGI